MSNILQEIFKSHFNDILKLNPRHSIIENVSKMIDCGDPSKGGTMYGCEKCGALRFVPFRCHSRFCPTCGNKYSQDRTLNMSFKLLDTQHRHCVFTIDSQLRNFFLKDRSLLNCLFEAVNMVVTNMFHKENKTELFTPGFICVLHTFGRDLKWNPHIHCLLSEGGVGRITGWRPKKHFNYTYLRNSFRTVLLKLMLQRLGPSFKPIISRCYREHTEGFYVYAKPNKCDPKTVTKYIGRYLGRPVIATSRIDAFDRENDTVTFHYNRHEDEKYIEETIPAMDFIKRLIRHIPEKHFKQIRYYGIYARHLQKDSHVFKFAVPASKRSFFKSFIQWRKNLFFSFGIDPLKCPNCGNQMTVLELLLNKEHYTLFELYNMQKEKLLNFYSLSPN